MTPSMKASLETVIIATVNEDTVAANAAFHQYLKEKTPLVLEAKDSSDDDSDDDNSSDDDKSMDDKSDDDKSVDDKKKEKLPPWLKKKKK